MHATYRDGTLYPVEMQLFQLAILKEEFKMLRTGEIAQRVTPRLMTSGLGSASRREGPDFRAAL